MILCFWTKNAVRGFFELRLWGGKSDETHVELVEFASSLYDLSYYHYFPWLISFAVPWIQGPFHTGPEGRFTHLRLCWRQSGEANIEFETLYVFPTSQFQLWWELCMFYWHLLDCDEEKVETGKGPGWASWIWEPCQGKLRHCAEVDISKDTPNPISTVKCKIEYSEI